MLFQSAGTGEGVMLQRPRSTLGHHRERSAIEELKTEPMLGERLFQSRILEEGATLLNNFPHTKGLKGMTGQVEQPRGEEGNESFQSSQGAPTQKGVLKRSLLTSAHRKGPDQESIFSFSRSPDRVMQTVDWELSQDAVSVPTLAQNHTESEDPCRQGTTLKSASPSLDLRGQTFIPPCPFLNEQTKTNQQYRKALYVKKIKSLREERQNSKVGLSQQQPQDANWHSQQVKSVKRSPSDKVKMTIKFLTQQTPVARRAETLDDLNSTSPSAKEKMQSKISRVLQSESKTPPPLSRNPLSKCGTSSINLSNSSTRKYQHNFKPQFSAAFEVQVQQSPQSPLTEINNQKSDRLKSKVREKERRIRELENEVQEIKARVDDIQNESNRSTQLYKSHYKQFKKERNEIEREKRDIATVQLQLKNTEKCARDLVSVLVEILELILVKKSILESSTSLLEESQISKELVVQIQQLIVRKLQQFAHSPVGIDLTQRLNQIRAIENVLNNKDNRVHFERACSETSSPLRREETEEYQNFLNFQGIQHPPPQRPKLHRAGSLQLGKTLSAFLSKNNKDQPQEMSYKKRVVQHVRMRITNCNIPPQDQRKEVTLNQQQTETSSTGSHIPSWSSSSGFSYAKNVLNGKRFQSARNAPSGDQYFPWKEGVHARGASAATDSAYMHEERKSKRNDTDSQNSNSDLTQRQNEPHLAPRIERDNNFGTDTSLMSTIRALTSELQKIEDRDPDEMIIASARRKEGTDELQNYLHRDPSLEMSDTFFANIKEAASNVELGPKFEVSKEEDENRDLERNFAIALYTFKGEEECDLTFEKGEEVEIVEWRSENQWCYGRIGSREGWLPKNYISLK